MKRGWILALGWLIWAGCMALLLPPRMRVLETRLHDAVRQHLTETGFDDVDVAMDGQSVQLRWHGAAPQGVDAEALRDNLVRAAEEATAVRPDDWPFARSSDWSDWATAPVIVATADEASVPYIPPPDPVAGTENDPRFAAPAPTPAADASSNSAPALPALATPAAAATVVPAPVASASASAAASCTDAVKAAISGRRLHFVSSSADLTPDSDAVLDDVYKVIHGCPGGLVLDVDGYTDNVGPPEANRTLSLERARSAAAALVKRGLPQTMVDAQGFGEDKPVAGNKTDAGRAANRRVVFVLRPA